MSLLTVVKASLSFTGKQIFDEIGFQVEPRDRIGLVGPNGSGKTTLLRLIIGEVSPDSGEVRVAKGARVGYLPQDVQETLPGPLLQSVIESVPGRVQLEHELRRADASLKDVSHKHEQTRIAEKLAEIHQEINLLELEYPRHGAEKILLGLGFVTSDFYRSVSSLSGGWKMRAALASLLYQKPDLLLLDEPTNHLDISSSEALINALSDYNGTLLFVSHNQSFINRLATKIWDIRGGEIVEYPGNLAEYFYHIARTEEESANGSGQGDTQEEGGGYKSSVKKGRDRKKEKRGKAEKRQLIYDTLKPILAEVERLEGRIAEFELRQKELEKLLADPDIFSHKNRGVPLLSEYKALRKEQDELLLKWEQSQDKLEATRRRLGQVSSTFLPS